MTHYNDQYDEQKYSRPCSLYITSILQLYIFLFYSPLILRLIPCATLALVRKGRRATCACGAQPVNYWSFNEWNCTPSRHPHRFLPSILTWRIDIAYLALPRRCRVEVTPRACSRHNFTNGIVLERVMRFRDRIVSRASARREGCVSLFLINNWRGSSDVEKHHQPY